MLNMTDFQQKISTLLPNISLRFQEPMAKHTSFKIGGPAEVMAFPRDKDELAALLKTSALLDCTPVILGAGTNVLAPDEGMKGLVICLKDCLAGMEQIEETKIRVAAGVTMARMAVFAAGLGLSGLEFAHGIPGTVGGGVYMNAGAYGGELSSVLESCLVFDKESGMLFIADADQCDFSYRHSAFMSHKQLIIVFATFELKKGDPDEIKAKIDEYKAKRVASQPLEFPSAGSTFKRPEGHFAGKLIEDAGLKGYTIGGAQVSEKHAGFVINRGGASASDIKQLVQHIQKEVKEKFDVSLECEIEFIG